MRVDYCSPFGHRKFRFQGLGLGCKVRHLGAKGGAGPLLVRASAATAALDALELRLNRLTYKCGSGCRTCC